MGNQLRITLKSNSHMNYISRRDLVKLPALTFANISVTQIITNFLVVGKIIQKEMAPTTSVCFLRLLL